MAARKVLLAFEERSEGQNLKELLESWDYEVKLVDDQASILKSIPTFEPHIIITESRFKDIDSLEVLKQIRASYEIPVIFIEKDDSIEHAVTALKSGAQDYFSKPVDIVRMKKVLENIASNISTIEEAQSLKEQLNNLKSLGGKIIGNSARIKEIFEQVEVCGPSEANVFITGSSGTGKELVARAIHDLSQRSGGPFIAINCSAIPETLLESEIFGHERGSFTGAIKTKEGCFELADGGTLFLDEITEMAPDLQSKLLRVLEDGHFRRVGGTDEISSNVRVLTASNKNIKETIEKGLFREDLFYRLNVFLLELPSLKERTQDIPLLAQHFIDEVNLKTGNNVLSADPRVFEILKNYSWPGNVRELRNVIERAVILCQGKVISPDLLPGFLFKKPDQKGPSLTFDIGAFKLDTIEKEVIRKTLEHLDGNKAKAAKVLGLSLKTLYNKINTMQKN